VEIYAPGVVTTSDSPSPWQATPRHCVRARRILTERERDG
jgi:hypothetical protein